ncbi:RHS repeat-associated protein [Dysgonomonas sp. PH5-45]|uniref:RHS repeat domain-containing protein n=1 Tax=unclassified Dysgonomonas TaxID=2630389 RepID=UPI00247589F7|nr:MULTISPECIES: RHS repeat-associated core domain-containing protein [unclassified Dysgonomonas]MDH6356078.1 RHS repeat-associated protein [Dysgonomonas sp. PH5-45]MDH6388969.1 RHS repeat-associated protein [Dysgonomonas sp. PH5-37]
MEWSKLKDSFYLKNHLGNIRAVVDAQGNTVQATDYYPFGMPTAASRNEGVQPDKYGGKEYDTMNGLEMYDFHARQYDPAIGRFTSTDPHAENYYSTSPYTYCLNNPLRAIDPTGESIWYRNCQILVCFDNCLFRNNECLSRLF